MMRRCLVEPIPEIFVAAQKLQQAVDAHLDDKHDEAEQLFFEADDPVVWRYTDQAWGKGCKERYGFITLPESPPHLARADRPQPRMPTPITQAEAIARDGRHCRFCGIPVISPQIRVLAKTLYPSVVKWGANNADQHAAFQCMWLQFDHVLPNGRGGDSSLANIIVTCAPCNFGRMEITLEEARLIDPRHDLLIDTWSGYRSWDGLERLRQMA